MPVHHHQQCVLLRSRWILLGGTRSARDFINIFLLLMSPSDAAEGDVASLWLLVASESLADAASKNVTWFPYTNELPGEEGINGAFSSSGEGGALYSTAGDMVARNIGLSSVSPPLSAIVCVLKKENSFMFWSDFCQEKIEWGGGHRSLISRVQKKRRGCRCVFWLQVITENYAPSSNRTKQTKQLD